jgi:aryl-alcohol dehydrogenase
MTDRMVQAAVLREAGGRFEPQTVRLTPLQAEEVLVRVAGVGICHTDLAVRERVIPVPLPAVLGHEAAGVVEEVGAAVHDIAPGDAVVLSFSSCGECPACDAHVPGYCDDFVPQNFRGARADGSTAFHDDAGAIGSHFFGQSSFADLAVTRRRNLVKVSSKLPLALLGPLGCGIQTGAGAVFNALNCPKGSSLAVFGAGSVGMSAVLAAVARECATIIVVEPIAARRDLALSLGATHAFDPGAEPDIVEAVRAIVPRGVAYSIDVTGVPAAIEGAIAVLAKRGTCALIGAPQRAGQTVPLRFGMLVQNGVRIIGVMEGDGEPQRLIPELLALHAAGRFPLDKLLTTYPFHDIERAIADQHAGACLKPVLVMPSAQS